MHEKARELNAARDRLARAQRSLANGDREAARYHLARAREQLERLRAAAVVERAEAERLAVALDDRVP